MKKFNRRMFLKAGAAAAAVAPAISCTSLKSSAGRSRPNILFIFTDDHAVQSIGAYEGRLKSFLKKHKITPNLDKLAKQGVIFSKCYCGNSICGPSRAAIQTGKHSHANGKMTNQTAFDGSQQTFPKLLQKGGYQTAIYGKWHLHGKPQGYDSWEVLPGQGAYYRPSFNTPTGRKRYSGHCTDVVTERALDWLENKRDPEKPFMLMVQHKAPHRTWIPAPAQFKFLKGVEVPEPDSLFDDYAGRPAAAKHEMGIDKHLRMDYDLKINDPASGKRPSKLGAMSGEEYAAWVDAYGDEDKAFHDNPPTGKALVKWKYQRYMHNYLRCIKGVDESVKTVRDKLAELGLDKNTIVIYSSDQGFYLGEHGWFDKRWMYEESFRMPFIAYWPGVTPAGNDVDAFAQNIDFGPTFLDIAGVSVPSDMHGESLVPLLKGKKPSSWRQSLYYHYYEKREHNVAKHYGVRTVRYKLINFYDEGYWELYDMEKDPGEMKNVYSDSAYAEVVSRLKKELKRLRTQYADTTGKPVS